MKYKIQNTRYGLAAAVLFALGLQGCYHYEDLCYDHPDHASVYDVEIAASYEQRWHYYAEGGIDWENEWSQHNFGMRYTDLNPEIPTGLSAMIYSEGQSTSHEYNMKPTGTRMSLIQGTHHMIFYNNDTEYIIFKDLDDIMTAMVTTSGRTRASYAGNPFRVASRAESTVSPPDMLYGACVRDFVSLGTGACQRLEVTMKPLVFTYLVRVNFDEGIEYVTLARGALSGMADGVSLATGHTSDDQATVLFDADILDWGVQAPVKSFGIPDYPNDYYASRTEPGTFSLNIELKLTSGNIVTLDYDVTDQVACHPQGGVIEIYGVKVEENSGHKPSDSGFDVGVNTWGEWEDIILDM